MLIGAVADIRCLDRINRSYLLIDTVTLDCGNIDQMR